MTGAMDASELTRQLRLGAAEGLTLWAHRAQAIAVPLTPLEEGDLRGSLVVTPATPEDLEAAVSSDSVYALAQHERMDYRHKVGGPKFLEKAALQSQGDGEKLVAAAVRRRLGG